MNIIKNLSLKYKPILIFSLIALLSSSGIYAYKSLAVDKLVKDVVPTQQIVSEYGNLTREIQIELLNYLRTGEAQTAEQFTATSEELLAVSARLSDYADDPGEDDVLTENAADSTALVEAGNQLIENHRDTLTLLERFGELDTTKDEERARIDNLLLPTDSLLSAELVTRIADRTDHLQAETLEFVLSGQDTTRAEIENVETALGLELTALTDLISADKSLPTSLQTFADLSAEIASISNEIVANHSQTLMLFEQFEALQGRVEENTIALGNLVDEDSTSSLQLASRTAFGFTILAGVLSLAMGLFFARGIVRSVFDLDAAAQKLSKGDFSVRVVPTSRDEIGNLMRGFNQLAAFMEHSVSDMQQQTQAITTSSEVSRRLSTILNPAELATAVVELLQVSFKYYHAHIYLYDDAREYLVMAGSTGEAGRVMLENNHKIESGKGLVGRTAEINKPTLVPDVTADPDWLPNPLLPETKAEVAVPITLENEVLGVLDIQHNIAGSLDEADVNLLTAVANQVAIGLQNANLLAESRRASEEMSRFKLALEHSPNAVFMTDPNGKIYYVNPGFEEVYGFSAEEAIGQTPRILKSGLIPEEQYSHFWQTLLAKEPIIGEIVNKTKDGRLIPVSASNNPIVDDHGQLVGFMGLHADMSERNKAENLLAKQARELSTVAMVGTTAATILDPAQLLQEVVDLTKNSFDLYHVHIHLLNDNKDTLVLTAGAGEIGQKMVAEGRRIPLAAEGSLVATVARTKQGAIRNYDPPGEGFMPHPLLSDTNCEMAVPISVGEEVLGVLDVRSDQLNYFTEEDMQTYTIMAGQIAVALQNARSYKRSEEAIQELQELSRRLTREGWSEFFEQQLDEFAFRYDLENISPVTDTDAESVAEPESDEETLTQPLRVQGESIGELRLGSAKLYEDEASEIVAAVAERLSAHLENLRLAQQTQFALNETQRRTEELAILNEMSQTLTGLRTVDGVFQTVYDYLSRLMDTTDFFTVLYDEEHDEVEFVLTASGEELHWYTERRQAGDGVTEYLIRQRQPLLMPDNVGQQLEALGIAGYGALPESWMGAPIILGDRVLGVIGLQSYTIPRLYNEQHLNLLTAVANQAAIAIESTRLLEGTTALAEEEQILRQITTRVSTAVDAESILRTAAEEIGRALGLEGYVSLEALGTNGTNGHKKSIKSPDKVKAN